MKSTAVLAFPAVSREPAATKKNSKSGIVFYMLFAMLSVFGGIAASIVGFALVVIHTALTNDTILNQIGTVLLIVSIPMLLVGSIFMDKLQESLKK